MDESNDFGFVPATSQPADFGFVPNAQAGDEDFGFVPTKGATPSQNLTKSGYNLIAGAAQSVASTGEGLQRLEDPGPLRNNFRTYQTQMLRAGAKWESPEDAMSDLLQTREADRLDLMAPGRAITDAAVPYQVGAQAIADQTPGSEHLAKAANVVGGMVPLLGVAAIPVVGPVGASVTGGLQATGDTYNQAFTAYKARGMSDNAAQQAADGDAIATGINSGVVYSLLPGAGKTMAERMMAERLTQASPIVQAGVRTLAQGADGSVVMGANALITSAQAMQSYNRDLSWSDAMKEAAKQAALGFVASASIHGAIEGGKLTWKKIAAGKTATQTTEPPSALPEGQVSEFGGAVQTSGPESGDASKVQGPRSKVPPVAETPETIAAQVALTKNPASAKAVTLVTPGEVTPDDHGLTPVETAQGTALVNTEKVSAEEAQAQLDAGQGGQLLGFSTDTKPVGAHILQTTDAQGNVVQDEVVTPGTLNGAIAAGQKTAPGGTVELKPAEQVIAERQAENPSQTVLANERQGAAPAALAIATRTAQIAPVTEFESALHTASGGQMRKHALPNGELEIITPEKNLGAVSRVMRAYGILAKDAFFETVNVNGEPWAKTTYLTRQQSAERLAKQGRADKPLSPHELMENVPTAESVKAEANESLRKEILARAKIIEGKTGWQRDLAIKRMYESIEVLSRSTGIPVNDLMEQFAAQSSSDASPKIDQTPNKSAAPAARVPAGEIATRPDLMQFKRMDDADSGVNAGDKLNGKWDDLKGGNLLLWEPKDPAQYGLKDGEKYIVANGHHRFEFGERQEVSHYNAQIVREADGYSAQDARALAAEINIADGKGTIYDQVKFLRNEAATHGTDAALARAGRTGAQGRQAAAIAFAAGPDLHAAFVNEQIKPEHAEAIARSAPVESLKSKVSSPENEGLQRLGIRKAIDGASPAELRNLIQAVRLEAGNVPPEQFDLFAADDSAIRTAEQLAKVASRIQGELTREIRATEAAAKNATTAKAKGLIFERPPEEILADNNRLKAERDQWDNWALHPELVAQVRGYAAMGRATEAPRFSLAEDGRAGDIASDERQKQNREAVLRLESALGKAGYQVKLQSRPPLADSLPNARGDRAAAQAFGSAVSAFEQATGRKIVFVEGKNLPFHGTVLPSEPSTLFINAAHPDRMNVALGHEFLESLQLAHPDIYNALASELRPLMRDTDAYRKRLNDLEQRHDLPQSGPAAAERELIADFTGDSMASPGFWRKLGDRNPIIFGVVADAMRNFLGKVLDVIRPYGANRFFRDTSRAQDILAKAVEEFGLRQSEQQRIEQGLLRRTFEPPKFSLADEGEDLRAFGQKLLVDPDISSQAKTAVSEYAYQKRANQSDAAAAQEIIQRRGVDNAIAIYKDDRTGLPGSVRSILGKTLIKTLADQERVARARGNTIGANEAVDKQVDVANFDLKRSTDIAQSLQAMGTYGDMSLQGILAHTRSVFGDAGDKQMAAVQPVADLVRDGFQKANDTAIRQTIADPKVNETARTAVNERIAGSDATRKGVVVEVTGAMAESPEIVRQAREALGNGQLNRILQSQGIPLGTRTKAELAPIFDELAKRAASIAAGHYQGAELGKPLAQKLRERLGLSEEASARLAKSIELKYISMVEAAQKKLPERIAAQRAKLAAPYDPNEINQTALDREIRRQLKTMNQKLGDLVKQHSSRVDVTGRTIGERVVKDSGLTGPNADRLRAAFDRRFAELATAAKQTELKRILAAGNKLPPRLKGAMEDLIKLTNTGAFDDSKFFDKLRDKLELPTVTPELAREVVKRANELQQLPEGFQRDRASTQLLNYIGKQKGLRIGDLAPAFWYAHTLSGITTPEHIIADNLGELAGNTLVSAIVNPRAIPAMPGALARGLRKGGLQAAEIMRTGIVTGVKNRIHTSSALELDPFTGMKSVFNNWKYVGRTMSAAHVLLFKPATELKTMLVARDVARREGLRGSALRQRVADIVGNTEARVATARAQATREGLTGLNLQRRMDEIIEQQREQSAPNITAIASEYGLRSTYLNEPYGYAGTLATALSGWFGKQEATMGELQDVLRQHGWGARYLASPLVGLARVAPRLGALPFARMAGNILDAKMNWTPVGAFRAGLSHYTNELYGQKIIDPQARAELYAKAAVGTLLTGAALSGFVTITGSGPASAEAKKQLMETGWRPHSVKVGPAYVSYLRTPGALGFAAIGNYQDAQRFKHLDDQAAMSRVGYALSGVSDAMMNQSYLDSLGELFEAAKNENPKTAAQKWEQMFVRTGSKFVVPNLISQVDRIFDPTVYDDKDMQSLLRAQVPFARRENRPAVNVLGEPIQRGIFDRDIAWAKPDVLWQTIADKQAWVPAPAANTIVGDRRRGSDHYRTLTPDELYDFTVSSGKAIRESLLDSLDELRQMEPEEAKKFVAKVTDEERKKAIRDFD